METNQRKLGVILSYISIAISIGLGLFQVPIYLSLMGESEWGIYGAMGSILACFSVMDFGLSATIIRFYSKYRALKDKKNMENILAICSIMYVILAIIAVVIGAIFYFYLDGWLGKRLSMEQIYEAKQIYLVILLNIAVTIPSQLFNAVLNAHERFAFIKILLIFQTILQFISVVAVLTRYPIALSLVIVQTIFNILVIPIKVYYCFSKLKLKVKLHNIDKDLVKSILSFAFLIFLTSVVDQMLWRVNPLIIISEKGAIESAIYNIAFTIFTNYMLLSTVISGVFLPKVTHMVATGVENDELSRLFIRIGRIQFLLLSCVLTCFVLFGKQFVNIFTAGKVESFESAYYITLLLIVPFTIDLIQNIGLTILQAQNKIAFRTIVFLVMALTNIIVALKLVKIWGGIGCAFSTGLVFFIGNGIVMNYYYSKYILLDIKGFWKEIFRISIVSIVCCILGITINFISVFNPIINLGIKIMLYLVLYVVAMWMFAMNNYEKGIFKGIIHKIKYQLKRT